MQEVNCEMSLESLFHFVHVRVCSARTFQVRRLIYVRLNSVVMRESDVIVTVSLNDTRFRDQS